MGGASLRWRNSFEGPLRGQRQRGTCRSERLVGGQHVPDRLGQPAGQIHLGDLRAALTTQPGLGPAVSGGVDRVAGGVDGRFDQRPAQVLGSVLGQRAAVVLTAGLVDLNRPGFARGWGSGHLAPLGDGVSIHDFPLNWRHVVD